MSMYGAVPPEVSGASAPLLEESVDASSQGGIVSQPSATRRRVIVSAIVAVALVGAVAVLRLKEQPPRADGAAAALATVAEPPRAAALEATLLVSDTAVPLPTKWSRPKPTMPPSFGEGLDTEEADATADTVVPLPTKWSRPLPTMPPSYGAGLEMKAVTKRNAADGEAAAAAAAYPAAAPAASAGATTGSSWGGGGTWAPTTPTARINE